jgi:hypothetical protein
MSNVLVALIVVELGIATRALDQGRLDLALPVATTQIQVIERGHDSETSFMVGAAAARIRANHWLMMLDGCLTLITSRVRLRRRLCSAACRSIGWDVWIIG